jgi:hypothetical protein
MDQRLLKSWSKRSRAFLLSFERQGLFGQSLELFPQIMATTPRNSCDGKANMEKQMQRSVSVIEIKGGKTPLIARGAFGRVDIALLVTRQHTSSTDTSHSTISSVSLAAIKTIPNATSSSKNNTAKLTREN